MNRFDFCMKKCEENIGNYLGQYSLFRESMNSTQGWMNAAALYSDVSVSHKL